MVVGIERDGAGGLIVADTNETLIGEWAWTLYDGDKEWNEHGRLLTPVLARGSKRNLITTVGKQLVLDRLFGLSSAVAVSGIAVGTSSAAPAVGDTAITGAVYKAFAATPVRSGLSVTGTVNYTTAEANINIQEVGGLTASGGVLFNRAAPFYGATKSNQFALDVTMTVTQA